VCLIQYFNENANARQEGIGKSERVMYYLFILVEMQILVEGLGNEEEEEEEGDSGFDVLVGKGREGAEDRINLSVGSGSTSVKFASMLEVFSAARAGFSGA
jgi:hypothetical protein